MVVTVGTENVGKIEGSLVILFYFFLRRILFSALLRNYFCICVWVILRLLCAAGDLTRVSYNARSHSLYLWPKRVFLMERILVAVLSPIIHIS